MFHRIICISGPEPIAPPLDFLSASTSGSVSDHTLFTPVDTKNGQHAESEMNAPGDEEKSEVRVLDNPPMGRVSKAFPTPSQQYADARTLARRRVYNMRYLRGECLWGPFQLVTRESLHDVPGPVHPMSIAKLKSGWGKCVAVQVVPPRVVVGCNI